MRKLALLCPSCRALLGSLAPRRLASTSFDPGRVLVVPKRSRLDYERSRGNLSDGELKSKLSEIGSDYQRLAEKHSVHQRSIEDVLSFLESEGVPLRLKSRAEYEDSDVKSRAEYEDSDVKSRAEYEDSDVKSRAEYEDSDVKSRAEYEDSDVKSRAEYEDSDVKSRAEYEDSDVKSRAEYEDSDVKSRAEYEDSDVKSRAEYEDSDVKSRAEYEDSDVEWADTIFSLGGDGNFLFTASKVLTPKKLVVGLNSDPKSSEGYLCLPTSPELSLTDTLEQVFRGRVSKAQRTRIRVCVGGKVLPVRALNELYVGEASLSQASSYELSFDGSPPEKQKSSGVIIYTGTGSTSWAYNMNQLTADQVTSLLSLARGEGLVSGSEHYEEIIDRITKQYNASNVYRGWENKMAFVVREPIVRGLFAAFKTRGYAQTIQLRSKSWHGCLIVDADFQYKFPRGSVATCTLHREDQLTTLDTTRTNDCFS